MFDFSYVTNPVPLRWSVALRACAEDRQHLSIWAHSHAR